MQTQIFRDDFLTIAPKRYLGGRDFIKDMIAQEVEEKLKDHARAFESILTISPIHSLFAFEGEQLQAKNILGLQTGRYDLILHLGALHAHNDVVGQLIQARKALKPDGVLIAAFLGGKSLEELRQAMILAEIEVMSGASQRVAPMIDLQDGGKLLNRAGLVLPVADSWLIKARYHSVKELIADLRILGLTNPLHKRAKRITRSMYLRLEEIYREKFACETGQIEASFELIFLTGTAPALNQPKALRPGSVQLPLKEAIEKAKNK